MMEVNSLMSFHYHTMAFSWLIPPIDKISGLQINPLPRRGPGPVVHWPGPGHLGKVMWHQYWLFHCQLSLQTKFQVSRALIWPKRGTCGTPTWSWPPWRGCQTSIIGYVMANNSPYILNYGSLLPTHGLGERLVVLRCGSDLYVNGSKTLSM